MKTKTAITILVLAAVGGALWLLQRPEPPVFQPVPRPSATSPQPLARQEPPVTSPAPAAQITVPDVTNAPTSLRPVLDTKVGLYERLNLARSLTRPLTSEEKVAVYGFLRDRHEEDDKQAGQVVKNKLMDTLCDQSPLPEGLSELLVAIYRDLNQHVVLRDYALQHLVPLYERLDEFPATAAQKPVIQQVLWDALAEADSSIAGTALLGLTRLAENHSEFEPAKLAGAALQLARAETTGELARITALQICARFGLQESLPLLQQTAEAGTTMALRISAVGGLGALGGSEQTAFLTGLANGPEPRLKLPAQQALTLIAQRQSAQAAAQSSSTR